MDEQGRAVPHQRIDAQSAKGWPDAAVNRLTFRAEVPALGYRLYRFARGDSRTEAAGGARIDDNGLSNNRLAIRLDPRSGVIVSCVDKDTGIELVGPEGWNVPLVLEDMSDTWSHGVHGYTEVIGRFGDAHVSVYEQGPLQASLLVERSFEGSTWLQQIILRHGEAELEIRNWLQWQGRWRLLKLAFAVPVHGPGSVHDVPFGWCERPCDGREVPVQMWSDVFGAAQAEDGQVIGLAVLNDGKYGCDVSDSTLRVTVLRSPPYAYHEPHTFGSKGRYDWIDQGEQEFTLVLRPHVGDWRDAGIVGRARALNLPAVPITMHGHPGSRPPIDSLLELTCNEMELTALKPAEDGDGYIVRLADRHGRGGQGELRWRGARFPIQLTPFEVTTWRLIERNGRWHASECDMLERLP
jgi:alpha-mannosidase